MKKSFCMLLFFIIATTGDAFAQSKKRSEPDVKVNVNREFDERGNLIRYDSTYTYSYSNNSSGYSNRHVDSLLRKYSGIQEILKSPFKPEDFESMDVYRKFDSIWKKTIDSKMNTTRN